jgi:hypothetical protein
VTACLSACLPALDCTCSISASPAQPTQHNTTQPPPSQARHACFASPAASLASSAPPSTTAQCATCCWPARLHMPCCPQPRLKHHADPLASPMPSPIVPQPAMHALDDHALTAGQRLHRPPQHDMESPIPHNSPRPTCLLHCAASPRRRSRFRPYPLLNDAQPLRRVCVTSANNTPRFLDRANAKDAPQICHLPLLLLRSWGSPS